MISLATLTAKWWHYLWNVLKRPNAGRGPGVQATMCVGVICQPDQIPLRFQNPRKIVPSSMEPNLLVQVRDLITGYQVLQTLPINGRGVAVVSRMSLLPSPTGE